MFDDDNIFSGDADIEMAELVAAGNRSDALKKRGICLHGWCKVPDEGEAKCNDCDKVFPSKDALFEERDNLMATYG